MPDYQKGKIYKIVCNETGLVYLGSTTQALSQRLQGHKKNYKSYLSGKNNYIHSFKVLENDNYNIFLIEDYLCERKEQLLSRERFWIENNDCVNKNFPTRTVKEWNEVNKDKLKMYNKKYRASTKGKEHKKEYLEKNKDCIKERNRIYFESNKDEILKQLIT